MCLNNEQKWLLDRFFCDMVKQIRICIESPAKELFYSQCSRDDEGRENGKR
jgi:hypothetical protein